MCFIARIRPVLQLTLQAFNFILKDPVLPMTLSGLTMNFMLYEKDYGLALARLYCRFNLQMKVVKSSL